MRLNVFPVIAATLAAMLSSLLWCDAQAQPSSPQNLARGQALYDEAVVLMDKKDYAAACPKLEEAIRIVPEGVGAKLELGKCYEAEGRLESAWRAYLVAAASAATAGQAERQQRAQTRAAALEPILSKLTIVVPAAMRSLPALKVRLDGMIVAPEQWGIQVPIDAGKHRIEATATGKRVWEKLVQIQAGVAQTSVQVGELMDAQTARIEARTESEDGASSGKSLALILGGGIVTTAAVAVGIGMAIAANGESSDAESQIAGMKPMSCAPPVAMYLKAGCAKLLDTRGDQDSLANTSATAFLIGSIAGAATAVYALWPMPESSVAAVVRPVPVVTANEVGLWVAGKF